MTAILRVEDLEQRFGGFVALDGVSFEVSEGGIAAIIGPNGAGKSTVFNAVTGVHRATAGRICFDGDRIDGQPTHRIIRRGIARTFQNIRLFSFMSALDNVLAGEEPHLHATIADSLLHPPRQRYEEREALSRARELLRFAGLHEAAHADARDLPYGLQRRLEIARALASQPKLLLLDEPAAGMNPREKRDLAELICGIRDSGVTILLIEHDMSLVMHVSEHITVLDHGEKIAEGTPEHVRADARVIAAYLGTAVA